jgi:hypothetical protein
MLSVTWHSDTLYMDLNDVILWSKPATTHFIVHDVAFDITFMI